MILGQLVGKQNYLTVTRPDIAFVVSVVSQFLSAPRIIHWEVIMWILRYLNKSLVKGFYIQIVDTPQLLVFQMPIWQDYTLTGDLP